VNQQEIEDLQSSIEENCAKYIDEWVMDQVENMIDEKLADISKDRESLIHEIKEELVYEVYKTKKELEDQIQREPKVTKKSFWKWWK